MLPKILMESKYIGEYIFMLEVSKSFNLLHETSRNVIYYENAECPRNKGKRVQ